MILLLPIKTIQIFTKIKQRLYETEYQKLKIGLVNFCKTKHYQIIKSCSTLRRQSQINFNVVECDTNGRYFIESTTIKQTGGLFIGSNKSQEINQLAMGLEFTHR